MEVNDEELTNQIQVLCWAPFQIIYFPVDEWKQRSLSSIRIWNLDEIPPSMNTPND